MNITENFLTVDIKNGVTLLNIREEYYKLLKTTTAESGCANIAEVLEWAKMKNYKLIGVDNNIYLFEKIKF